MVSYSYEWNVVEVLKHQIEMYASATHLLLRSNPKDLSKHPMETVHIPMLEIKTWRRILRNGPQQVFWNDNSTALPKSFAGLVHIFSDEAAFSLKGSALIAKLVHAALLTFSDAYLWGLVQIGHALVEFLHVECAAEQQGGNTELTASRGFVWVFLVCSSWSARPDSCNILHWWKKS